MKKIILRNDPAKERKKLGKVKDLLDQMGNDLDDFEIYIESIKSRLEPHEEEISRWWKENKDKSNLG